MAIDVDLDTLKQLAHRGMRLLESAGLALSHKQCLDLVARMHGFTNYEAAKASLGTSGRGGVRGEPPATKGDAGGSTVSTQRRLTPLFVGRVNELVFDFRVGNLLLTCEVRDDRPTQMMQLSLCREDVELLSNFLKRSKRIVEPCGKLRAGQFFPVPSTPGQRPIAVYSFEKEPGPSGMTEDFLDLVEEATLMSRFDVQRKAHGSLSGGTEAGLMAGSPVPVARRR